MDACLVRRRRPGERNCRTRRCAASLPWLLAAFVAGCTPSGDSDEQRLVFEPVQFPATAPGMLVADPPALHLAPGDAVALTVRLLEGDGSFAEPGTLSWSASTPAVASVDSTGSVQAAAVGGSEIRIEDGEGRTVHVPVAVSETGFEGAFSARFEPAARMASGGEEWTVEYTVLDGRGEVLSETEGLTLASTRPESVEVDGLGVRAKGSGIARLFLQTDDGVRLYGHQLAVVVDSAADADGGAESECGTELRVAACDLHQPPMLFSRPGLDDTLEIGVYRTPKCYSEGSPFLYQYTIEAPTRVELDVPGVLEGTAEGRIRSAGAGRVRFKAFAEGVACGEQQVYVGMDLGGAWSGTCSSNNDRVELSFEGWPSVIMHSHFEAFGGDAPEYFFFGNVHGSGCVSNDADGFSCSGEAEVTPFFAPCDTSASGACEDDASCCAVNAFNYAGPTYAVCGPGRGHGGELRGGGETLRLADCELAPGGGGCGEGPGEGDEEETEQEWLCAIDYDCDCYLRESYQWDRDDWRNREDYPLESCGSFGCDTGKVKCCTVHEDGRSCNCECADERRCEHLEGLSHRSAVSGCPPS